MKKRLKVGIGSDAFPPTTDGISNVAKSYALEINKHLGEAIVITPKNPNQQDYKYPYKIYRYKSWWLPSKEGYSVGWPFNEKLHQDIIDMNFDILHSHAPLATSVFFRLVCQKKKIPVVLTYHTKYEYDIEKRVPTKAAKKFAYGLLQRNINAADEVWVTSEGSADSLRKIGYNGDYVLMPNGCDLPKANVSQINIELMRAKHNISKDTPVFLYVGRLIMYKNIELILDVCKIIADDKKDFKLIMLGFGADERKLKRYARKIGINDKIIWTGQILERDILANYYAFSDILLFPSVFDTNGLVVREAAACATPSLLIEGSCAAEGITNNETGFLCKENAADIANKLEEIMNDKELLSKVGKKAQEEIYISWSDAVEKAYNQYYKVIEKFNSKNK